MERDADVFKTLRGWRAEDWPLDVCVSHEGHADRRVYVPERTCRLSYVRGNGSRVRYVCSFCGEWLADTYYEAYVDEMSVWIPYRFCPRCGAKVEGGPVE